MRNTIRISTLVFLLLTSPSIADPGSADIGQPLSVHGWCQGSKELAAECYGIWKSNIELVKQMEKATAERNPKGAPGKECGKLHSKSKRLERLAGLLIEMGEPAGVDFLLRSNRMGWAAVYFSRIVKPTPEGAKMYTASKKKMERGTRARESQIQSMQKRMPTQAVTVEKELYDAYEDFWVDVIFFSNPERDKVMGPYNRLIESKVAAPVKAGRKKKNLDQLAARLKVHQPNIAALTTELEEAAKALASGPSATVQGKAYSGPDAFEKLFHRWQIMHLGLIRCVGIDSAMRMIGKGAAESESFTGEGATTVEGPWNKAAVQLTELMLAKLPALIAADAARTSGPEAHKLYLAYLAKLAPLCRRTGDDRLANACRQPLEALVAKSGPAGEFVTGYQKATDDILLWRGRQASALVRSQKTEYPSITEVFKKANLSDKAKKYVGLLPDPTTTGEPIPTLKAGADEVLPVPITRIGTSKASVSRLCWIPKYNLSCAGLREHTFASVPKVDVAAHVAALKKDLMIAADQPPLSLASAISSTNADSNQFEAAGGNIHSFYLEAAISRFANLPVYFETLLPVTSLPDQARRDEMLMRFNVLPKWVAHKHFFAPVTLEK